MRAGEVTDAAEAAGPPAHDALLHRQLSRRLAARGRRAGLGREPGVPVSQAARTRRRHTLRHCVVDDSHAVADDGRAPWPVGRRDGDAGVLDADAAIGRRVSVLDRVGCAAVRDVELGVASQQR